VTSTVATLATSERDVPKFTVVGPETSCPPVLRFGPICTIDGITSRTDTHSTDVTQGIGPCPHFGPSRQSRSPAHVRHIWNAATL